MQPIETIYNNYRFRSRLEARWAVFFDTLGIEYQYEPEGFELGNGIRYLPDFYLPGNGFWVEIKAGIPTPLEREKAARLCVSTQKPVFIMIGEAWKDAQIAQFFPHEEDLKALLLEDRVQTSHHFCWLSSEECIDFSGQYPMGHDLNLGYQWCFAQWGQCPVCHQVSWAFMGYRVHHYLEDCQLPALPDENRLERAFLAARQARFEHGERGK